MNDQSVSSGWFSVRRVTLWTAVVAVCILARIGIPVVWQAFKERQNRTRVQENLTAIGEALEKYEQKMKGKRSEESKVVEKTETSK